MFRQAPWSRQFRARLLLAALLLVPSGVRAAISHDYNLTWQTLKSAHFRVHYHNGGEGRAREVVAIAERVHERLSPLFRWTPAEPTDIVVTDEYDVSNGYTSYFPANRVVISLAPPDETDSLEDNSGWLDTVITHEYAHVLHLDKARGFPEGVRSVLGRASGFLLGLFDPFPNAYQPLWLLEGIATYYETDLARGYGRGQSTYFDMLMRMESADGPKPLRQVNQEVDTWPHGYVPYLYGVQWYNFVVKRYGEDKVQKLVDNYSDNIVPFRILSNTAATVGSDLDKVWRDFERDRQEHYRGQIAAVRERGEESGRKLTTDGYSASQARALPDGTVFYVAFDGRNDPALRVLRPGAEKPEKLRKIHYGARIDVHPEAGVLVAQPEVCRNARYYYDLYRVDSATGGSTRLTRCARYRSAAWSPDGKRIAAIHHEFGNSSLDVLDASGRPMERLWSGRGDEVVTDIDWSPDGAMIAAAVWRRETGWNIEVFVLAEKRWRALTNDSAIDAQPQFSLDGRAVLFSSDHGGIYNIRRIGVDGGTIETLSNVIGGALYPTATATGDIYYIGYGAQGFDLYRLAPAARATPRVAPGPSAVLPDTPPMPADVTSEDYSVWTGLRPRWWFPHLTVDDSRFEIGALTSGSDALNRHLYAVDLAYDVKNNTPVGSLSYVYDRWYPIFKLYAGRDNDFYRNSNDEVVRIRHVDTYLGDVILPWRRYDYQWAMHLGAVSEKESDFKLDYGAAPRADSNDSLLGVAVVFNSSKQFPLSVSRSHGREVRVVAEDSDVFSSDYSGNVYTLDWREFLSLGGEHVLALRAAYGWGTDNPRPFRLGGSDGSEWTLPLLASPLLYSPFNIRDYPLRGYPEGLASLEGRRMQLVTAEYRFPIRRIERGWMTPPMAVHQLFGSVFVDNGATWNDGNRPSETRTGAGIEAYADVAALYSLRFTLRLGYAHGFDDGGENSVYLRIGSSF